MGNFFEILTMNNQKKSVLRESTGVMLISFAVLIFCTFGSVQAKSLYVLSDIEGNPQPIQVYDIAVNGKLTYQAQYTIPRWNLGAVGIAMDSDSGYLFITYSYLNSVVLVNSKTMSAVPELAEAPGSYSLTGVAYDHKKGLLYCVDRGRNLLWVYSWDPKLVALTLVEGAPFYLQNASAFGIALDELNGLLYVANSTNRVYAYSTKDWTLKRTITLNRAAVSIAVDVRNGYLYAGGGYVDNPYLTQYNLATNAMLETLVEPEAAAGIMGLAVDPNSSKIYMTTGNEVLPGGDNIRVYDKLLHPVDVINQIGNPTGLVIPSKEVGYNPLGLKKTISKIVSGEDLSEQNSINAGDLVTYQIFFGNNDNINTITNVSLVDNLPSEVSFVSATDDGTFGHYDPTGHIYTWTYPSLVKNSTACLEITVKVNSYILPKTTITNTATIRSDTTPPITTRADVVTASRPLNVRKTVFGATPGQTKWVDANEVITYNIYVDNNDNSFAATDVLIADKLPAEVVFLKADEDIFGIYDAESHTFSWSVSSLGPQESINVGITVRLKNDVPDGTTITNTVTVNSVETSSADSSVDIKVGTGPLQVSSVQVIPGTIRRDGALSGIMVIVEMPKVIKVSDVKNTPLFLSLIGENDGLIAFSNNGLIITQSMGKTYVIASFNKDRFMNAIPGYGPKNILIEGTLTNGGMFAGETTVNITRFTGS